MKDKIIELLKAVPKAFTITEISKYLKIDDLKELESTLTKLVEDGFIHKTRKNKYIDFSNSPSLKVGKLDVTRKGYAFVLQNKSEDDVYVSADNLNGAVDGDFVLIDTFKRRGKIEGRVLEILKRNLNNVIGTIHIIDNIPIFELDNKKLNINVELDTNYFKNLVDGHKVLVEITEQISNDTFLGTIKKIIGHVNDPDIDIVSIAYKHEIELDFSEKVKEELKSIPEKVFEKDKVGRVDLTNEMIFTIDGDDTKDIDDAISIKYDGNYYELGVHIADVTYYVKKNSALHKEAYERGTSNYLADRVIPMLPHELSNGICSLNPGVERLAISVIMKIDASGKVINSKIFESVIKSRKQMTYKCVNKILEEGITPEGYEEYKDTLELMQKLASILRKVKIKKGYIEFAIPEAKIIQDENGKCIDVVKKEQHAGEKLIEDFMIIANETVATSIQNMGLPFIYRVHGLPKQEKIDEFLNLLKELKINVNTKGIEATSKDMQRLLNELQDKKEFSVLSSLLLRSMQKAIYSTDNIGHFGLAIDNYTHFTSPIRRFPDTTVHELLRTYLFNKKTDNNTINYYETYLKDVAEHSSEKEQNAIDAEREVVSMKMAEYMESHIGEEYTGIITSVTNYGFYVQLPNLIEGLVHVNSLKGYFTYVEEKVSLISKNNTSFRLGDTVTVRVISADKNLPGIDFEVV